ncbi:ornithine cyclodeaminase family protein [Amycolatopsis acidiphila]|uniref:Ornithine cyclodeaminase family protein n=1 Tax=Amycolatopsis acidiphila TaxID=715473 RepID=A0A557ZQE8_9PSEU|nr:ornithine cyclodeaminase family protein [Amycolatopsis acidiphila]TVT14247.1 ornithine cyclodeaminase family protein [Amycolatopsis acidiphila]UIJ63870.1 ornithine cyclodeaminase family protein [Amycolatopsis acidiphila]GHG64972.1 ornithine cyclodeaminase [Amycolatopsis acidiphila]
MRAAVEALAAALRGGLDPDADPPRSVVPVRRGQLLLMPAEWGRYAGVKLATVAPANPGRGLARIQGQYLLLDAETLTPLDVLDGVALTSVRTAAVSAVAVDALAEPAAARLVVFGSGPQARSHVEALRAVRPVSDVVVVGRDQERARVLAAEVGARVGSPSDVAGADLVACCTTAREPLFDGALLAPHATVVAVGSHEPDAREVDAETVRRSTVVVESRETALREAGDVVQAVSAGACEPGELLGLAAVVRGEAKATPDAPRLFKSVGMAWEDLVIAARAYEEGS